MDNLEQFHVGVDEQRLPGNFVVIVEETGCRTLYWQFYQRRDAERKARAELERLEAQYLN